jgi:transcriptional regulator of acetoin/glycerol metabolism
MSSEEAQRLRAVAHQDVFRLLVMIQHHLMVFASDARLLVAAERRTTLITQSRPVANGNIAAAARKLRISRNTLYRRLNAAS